MSQQRSKKSSEQTRVITVRLPDRVHEALKREAEFQNRSVNKLVLEELLSRLGTLSGQSQRLVESDDVLETVSRLTADDVEIRSYGLFQVEAACNEDNRDRLLALLDAIKCELLFERDFSVQRRLVQALSRLLARLTFEGEIAYSPAVGNEADVEKPSGMEAKMDRPRTESPATSAHPVAASPAGYDPSVYERGLVAFERDLPEFLKTHFGQWVIYHGDHRFGPAETFQELDSACQEKRIPIGEQVVRMIEPEVEPEMSF